MPWIIRGDEAFQEPEKPFKPYDFKTYKTTEEEFRKQIDDMFDNTKMDTVLDENFIRKKRKTSNEKF